MLPYILCLTVDRTVLRDMTSGMLISSEETFGPVAAVYRFETEEEAIKLANDTPYGLASYLFTSDSARSWRFSSDLETGMVGINVGLISTEVAPFGGIKESGLGREGGSAGIGTTSCSLFFLFPEVQS